MAGVATAFDRPLEPDDFARADLERTLAAIADDYPDLDVESEASIPAAAGPLINDVGLSPGCVVTEDDCTLAVLPGIPEEMEVMLEQEAEEFAGDVESRRLYTEEPEANLIERLDRAREEFGAAVGCYPDREAGHNRLVVRGQDADAVERAAE